MITTINNDWITLSVQRNGVDVQRKFAGLDTFVNLNDEVEYCKVKYWEKELYPNNEELKVELKYYSLEDLDELVNEDEGWKMEARAVLSGFVNSLGYPGIIDPARDTLNGVTALPITVPSGYALHKDTRPKIQL